MKLVRHPCVVRLYEASECFCFFDFALFTERFLLSYGILIFASLIRF